MKKLFMTILLIFICKNVFCGYSWEMYEGYLGNEVFRLALRTAYEDSLIGKFVTTYKYHTGNVSCKFESSKFQLKDYDRMVTYNLVTDGNGGLSGNMVDEINDVSYNLILKHTLALNENGGTGTIDNFLQTGYPSGFWISENYIEKLKRTSSPRLSQDSTSYLKITDVLYGRVNIVYNFHEALGPMEITNTTGNLQLWMLSAEHEGEGIYFDSIQRVNQRKIKIGNISYTKLDLAPVHNSDLILEELLFRGTYKMDSSEVIFTNEGKVTGLKNYTVFRPVMDYYDAGMQIDLIDFFTGDTASVRLAFKFTGNKLEIFNVKCLDFDKKENKCVNIDYGKLLFTLQKVEKK
jgi:hypothetical protein